jgi:hypothetical protein
MRKQVFKEIVWPKAVDLISANLITANSRMPGAQKFFKKINLVTAPIKERVLELFFARQSLLHTVRFLQYVINKKGQKVRHNLF